MVEKVGSPEYSSIPKIYYKILPSNIRLRADEVLSSVFLFFLEPLYYGSYPSIIEAAIHDLGVLDYEVNVQWAGNYNYYIKFISTYGEGFCLKLKVIKSLLDLAYCKYFDYYLDKKRNCLSTCLKYRWQLALIRNSNVALFFFAYSQALRGYSECVYHYSLFFETDVLLEQRHSLNSGCLSEECQ